MEQQKESVFLIFFLLMKPLDSNLSLIIDKSITFGQVSKISKRMGSPSTNTSCLYLFSKKKEEEEEENRINENWHKKKKRNLLTPTTSYRHVHNNLIARHPRCDEEKLHNKFSPLKLVATGRSGSRLGR